MKTKAKTTATTTETTIQKLNAAYQAASPAQRRVMIAKDALAQIKAERFTITPGQWSDVTDANGAIPEGDEPLQPILLEPKTKCECCGVGAIFLSHVRLANAATYDDGDGFDSIRNVTDWPHDNLRLIEIAFEQGGGSCNSQSEDEDKAIEFGEAFDLDSEATERLVEILKNIIANNGTFIP